MGIPVNALGFAGRYLSKNQSELVKLQEKARADETYW